jgi:hypothetical protein
MLLSRMRSRSKRIIHREENSLKFFIHWEASPYDCKNRCSESLAIHPPYFHFQTHIKIGIGRKSFHIRREAQRSPRCASLLLVLLLLLLINREPRNPPVAHTRSLTSCPQVHWEQLTRDLHLTLRRFQTQNGEAIVFWSALVRTSKEAKIGLSNSYRCQSMSAKIAAELPFAS